MEHISQWIGEAIRKCRKNRGVSQTELAERINKSKSAVSKYENGEISVDIETLSEIADTLQVSLTYFTDVVVQRRRQEADEAAAGASGTGASGTGAPGTETPAVGAAAGDGMESLPALFRKGRVYLYFYDARSKSVQRSVLLVGPVEEARGRYRSATLYINVQDENEYYYCENSYHGHIEFHHVLTGIYLVHDNTDLEHVSILIPENFQNSGRMWGMYSGIAFQPLQPVAMKVLLSSRPLPVTEALKAELKVDGTDVQKLRRNNWLTVPLE